MASRAMVALLFVAWVGEWPREIDVFMYSGLWRSPFEVFAPLFAPLPGIRMFTWQLLLIALVPVCLTVPGAFRHRAREMDAAILVSLGSIAVTFLWGWLRGGEPYAAYYQVWRFLTGLLVGYMLMSVIRTPRDLRLLAMAIISAALIRGTLVMYFYWVHVHGKINPPPPYMTNHDDSLLFVTAILTVGSWAVLKGRRAAWVVASLVSLYLFYAIVLNDRRIAWVELVVAMVAIYFLIGPGPLRRRINRWLIVAAPVLLLYVVVGWGQEAAIFKPIRALSSVDSNADASQLARLEENRNLLYTMSVAGNPLLGTGWGVPYQRLTTIYNNYAAEWVLAFYTPHNSLLGLAVFAGLVGILGIWGVVPVAAYLAARGYRLSADPTQRTATTVATGILAAYSVHTYGDIGFQSFPCCLILGVALAIAGKVAAWSKTPALAKAARAPANDPHKARSGLPTAPAAVATRVQGRPALRQAMPTATHGPAAQAGQAPTRRARP
jgi:hypothetical protein